MGRMGLVLLVGILLVFVIVVFTFFSRGEDSGKSSGEGDVFEEVHWTDVRQVSESYDNCDEEVGQERDMCILELASFGFSEICEEISDPNIYDRCYEEVLSGGGYVP